MARFACRCSALRVIWFATVTAIALDAQAESPLIQGHSAPDRVASKSTGPRLQDFAEQTVMVIGANVGIGATQATGDLLNVSWGVSVEPSVEVFIFRSVSLGATLNLSYANSKDRGSAVSYGVTPRIGYALPFGKNTGFWPRLGLGILRGIASIDNAPALHESVLLLNLFAPMYFIPVGNVLLGIGPVVSTELVSRVEGESHGLRTTIGFQTEIAGWL